MCGPKGYGFSAVLDINRVSILATLAIYRVLVLQSRFALGMIFKKSYFVMISDNNINKSPSQLSFRATVTAAMVMNRVSNFWSGRGQYRAG